MKKALSPLVFILISTLIFSSCGNNQNAGVLIASAGKQVSSEESLRAANDQFYDALNAMFTGELQPMDNIWSHGDDVTQLGPFGDCIKGWSDVGAEWQREAQLKLGGKVECKDLLLFPGKEIGFTVCTEEGQNMSANGRPVYVKFRATNIFRLENGQWKLVHHHTDLSTPLQEATLPERK